MSSSPRPSSRLCHRRLSQARRSHGVSAPRMKGAEGETLVTPFDFSVREAKPHREEAESEGDLAPEEKSCAVSLHELESQSRLSCSLSPVVPPLQPPPPPSSQRGPRPLSLAGTPSHRHYRAFISSAAAARHGQPPPGPPGYFTNNLFLISRRAPLPVIKEPINGAGKGEAFK